ncbi:MAG: efflux RND transporter periplasmic adaptor subunit [Betaproteobacteria bacterium]
MTEQRHANLGIHAAAAAGDEHHELLRRRQIVRRLKIVAVVVLVLLGLGAARTVLSRAANAKALDAGVAEHTALYVKTTLPKPAGAGRTVALPGTLQGAVQAPIAARAAGYVKRIAKDIGSRVDKGDVLAEIEAPELDQQVTQADAARAQTASAVALAESTVARWEALRKKDVVSQQDLDERRAGLAQARANLAAAEANLQRLRQLGDFKRVTAPFAGIVTRRNVDVGDLIDTSGKPLFLLSQTDPLRVYVSVPQAYANLVKTGQAATVTQVELRDRQFTGQVTRTSGAIDTTTRTMQIEVSLPNKDGVLLPGAYVQVALPLGASATLTVPSNALLFRGEGTRVALVDGQGKVTLRAVTLGRNNGSTVEVTGGLAATDRLVLNPPDALVDGDVVTLLAPAKATM